MRFKITSLLTLLLVACNTAPTIASTTQKHTASADNWQQYQNIMSRYYMYDDQKFSQITCVLEVQPLTGFVEKIKQTFASVPDKLRISDTLNSYTMTLDKKKGLTFHDPTLSIDILSEKSMTNPDLAKRGIHNMIDGFNTQVDGVNKQLKGIFEIYRKDKPGEITITKIEATTDGYFIESKQDKSNVSMTIHGDHVHSTSVNTYMSATADTDYKKTEGDKQLVDRLMLVVKQPLESINEDSTFTYQKLGTILFPETIQEHVTMTGSRGMQSTFPITIHFANCKVSE
jgi:hypothetical protein